MADRGRDWDSDLPGTDRDHVLMIGQPESESSNSGRELVGRELWTLEGGEAPPAVDALAAATDGAVWTRTGIEHLGARSGFWTAHTQLLVVGHRI